MSGRPTGTVTFLFTDIEGSTRLARQHPESWEAAQQQHHKLLRGEIEAHNGFIFQVIGDAFCAAFYRPREALKAAYAAQHALQNQAWGDCVIRVRMGIHTGEAEHRDGEYQGYLTLSLVQRIMSAGHGGQILVSGAAENLLRSQLPVEMSLRDLGKRSFRDVPELVRVFQVSAPVLQEDFPPLRSAPSHPNNLPAQLTSFVGREKELADIQKLLLDTHLLTLIGPGGTGKTRLSIRVASNLLDRFPDGLWLVELAPILDPLLVPRVTAMTMGLRDEPQRPVIDMLCDYLREKKMLIVLDNCEHLVEACARMADKILQAAPDVRILASSREALGIGGEVTYRVPSLDLPDVEHLPPVETLSQYEAVKLFIDRAKSAKPTFSVTDENAPAVAQICHRLEGIPLAIELAAAKIRVLGVEQIAKRLDDRFRLLTGGSRTALERHQTLRAAIDWSYNLLLPMEQVLFHRLSVFVGGWTLEAAEAVCEGGAVQSDAVLDLLEQLIHKSLVIKEEESGEDRYHMLETIRQYAHEKLVQSEEEQSIRDRHLNYLLKLSEQIETGLMGPQQGEWLAHANKEHSNLHSAREHAVKTNIEAGLYISGRLAGFWEDSYERRRWLSELLQKPESKEYPHARAQALYLQSRILDGFEQYHEAYLAAEESLVLFRAVGDLYGEVDSLISLGWIFGHIADSAKRTEILVQALALAKTLGDIRRQAHAWNALGWDHSDFTRAFTCWEQAISLYRQMENWGGLANTLSDMSYFLLLDNQIDLAEEYLEEANLLFEQVKVKGRGQLLSSYGEIAFRRGDFDRARDYFQEDARINNELGNRTSYLWARTHLGFVELRAGDLNKACRIFSETAQEFQKDGSRIGVIYSLEGMSGLFVAASKTEASARLIGWADAERERIGDTRPKLEQADIDKVAADCTAKLGEATFSDMYAEGKKMTLDGAMMLAVKTVEEIQDEHYRL